MPADAVFIYGLRDPRTREIRYIGKTRRPKVRYREHLRLDGINPHKDNWIALLATEGLRPEFVILEKCCEEEWAERERLWIEQARASGWPLTNICDGGNCPPPKPEGWVSPRLGCPCLPEVRQKISATLKGHPVSDETRQRMREAKRNLSPQARENMRVAQLGKKRTPEQRQAQSSKQKGRRNSEESKRKLSAVKMGHPVSQETRDKIAQALVGRSSSRGHCHTEESKQKMRDAALRRPRPNAETRAKLSIAHRGRTISAETREKLSTAAKNRAPSAYYRKRDARGRFSRES